MTPEQMEILRIGAEVIGFVVMSVFGLGKARLAKQVLQVLATHWIENTEFEQVAKSIGHVKVAKIIAKIPVEISKVANDFVKLEV